MLRETIEANPSTDVDAVLATLTRRSQRVGLSEATVASILEATGTVLRALCEQGGRLAANGSQMTVARDVKGAGYHIQIRFRSRTRRGPLAWLLGR